jgi:hypothetical protein
MFKTGGRASNAASPIFRSSTKTFAKRTHIPAMKKLLFKTFIYAFLAFSIGNLFFAIMAISAPELHRILIGTPRFEDTTQGLAGAILITSLSIDAYFRITDSWKEQT